MGIYGFTDGGYVRKWLQDQKRQPLFNPYELSERILRKSFAVRPGGLDRLYYYDGEPDEQSEKLPTQQAEEYWAKIARLPNTERRFGYVRGGKSAKSPPRQKAVDTMLAVDLVVGAYNGLFQVALIIAGDLDLLPAIHEARRRGVNVWLAGFEGHVNDLLIDEVDQYVEITIDLHVKHVPCLVKGDWVVEK